MRKLALLLAAVVLSAGPTLCQTPDSPWAEKLFDHKTKHDFGTVALGAQLKHSFPIKNIYNVPLNLTISRVSCGCLTPTLSKKTLQPLEEATLDIVIDGSRLNGPKTVDVFVTVGPEYISTAVVHVSANARKDVVFNPGGVDFGVVALGQQPTKTIDIEYAGLLDWRVKEVVQPANPPFTVTMEEKYRNQPNGKQAGKVGYRLTVKLAADAPAGILKHDLALKTNDPASEVLIVSVDGNVQLPLQVAPDQVNFGAIKLGETKNIKVQVRGNRPFRIIGVKSEGREVSAEIPQQAQPVHNLTLRCQPMSLGELTRTLTILTDLDKNSSVTVTVRANATQ